MAVAFADVVPIGPTVADQILEAGRSLAHSQHRLVVLAAEFDEGDEWWASGAGTAAHWLAAQLDVCVATAREWIRIGKALRDLPAIATAFERRELSYAKVRALSRVAEPDTESELAELARAVPAGRLGHALAAWSRTHEDHAARDARHRRDRSLRHRVEADGMVTITLRLPPQDAQAVLRAVEATVMRRSQEARSPEVAEDVTECGNDASADASGVSLAQQRADALVELATDGGADVVTEVIVHVRGDGCSYDDGTPVTDTVVERLAPEAFLRALIHDADGRPINASSRRRHPSARQRRVVKERDRCCSDCGATELLEYDHVPSYTETGHTITDELELRCAPCHLDGGDDGTTWRISTDDIPTKLRRTPPTWELADGSKALHWDGQFGSTAELTSDTIRNLLGGDGLLVDTSKVAAYLAEIDPPPPAPTSDPAEIADIAEGAVVFASECAECHAGELGSDGVAHDLGRPVVDPDGELDEVVTPTLLGTRSRAPYFHDGSAPTLDEALAADAHGTIPVLTPEERRRATAYLATR